MALPARGATWIDTVQLAASEQPDGLAFGLIPDGESLVERVTFGQLDERARRVGANMQDLAAPGDRILICLPNGPEFLAAYFGCLYAGMIGVPLYPPASSKRLSRLRAVAADADAAVVIVNRAIARDLGASSVDAFGPGVTLVQFEDVPDAAETWTRPHGITAESLAMLQYTSGSTGNPKGVRLTHGNLLRNCEALEHGLFHEGPRRFVSWLPLFHDMGLIANALWAVTLHAPLYYMTPQNFIRRPERWLRAISQHRGTVSFAPNFAYELCLRNVTDEVAAQLDLSTWRIAVNGAEPVQKATIERFSSRFAGAGLDPRSMLPAYGLAEASVFVSGGPREQETRSQVVDRAALEDGRVVAATSGKAVVGCGKPPAPTRVVAVRADGKPARPDEIGELWIHGPSVSLGYWNAPETTAGSFGHTLREPAGLPAHGWLASGDKGFVDAEGYVYPTGRIKDLIIKGGRNIYPQDIEDIVVAADERFRGGCTAAFAVSDEDSRVVVVQEADAAIADLTAPARRAVAEAASAVELTIDEIVLIRKGTISKTSSGKIARRETARRYRAGELPVLARWAAEDRRSPSSPPPVQTVRIRDVRSFAAKVLECEADDIDADEPLALYGLGSRGAIALAALLTERVGREIDPQFVYDHPTLREIVKALAAADHE